MNHKEIIESVRKEFQADSDPFPTTTQEIDALRNKYLGRKGVVANLFGKLSQVELELRPEFGKLLNILKNDISSSFESQVSPSKDQSISNKDYSLPGWEFNSGRQHPLQATLNEIKSIFTSIGFSVAYGPEIDDDFHNFGALNFPPEHPARDMQDTFFISLDPDTLLRTHTSSVQIRYMEQNQPPIRIISPGRVYRKEDISARAHCIFHQIEGLYIDQNVSFSDLKKIIMYFVESLFGKDVKIRFRPSFFPFTEPSAEIDIYWGLKTESDYRITKGTGWLEVMGCGMIDPNVLKNVNIDPKKFSGFAFGLGIERIAMLKHEIIDIREFYKSNLDFLEQFK